MDNLKFKAWIPAQTRMVDVLAIDFQDCFIKHIHHSDVDFADVSMLKEVTLIQSTYLKDKSGKDIFEGDIVRWDDMSKGERWRVAVVERKRDIQFRIIRIKCDYEQSAQDGYVFQFGRFAYQDTENHLEIIGNIYENADLLIK